MPLKKFRRVQDMPPPPELQSGDPNNLRLACELSELAAKLSPAHLKAGVRFWRSVEKQPQDERPAPKRPAT